MTSLLVVRLRGTANMRRDVAASLERLRLLRRYTATIVPNTKDYLGLLRSSSAFVAWCEADKGTVLKLLRERGRLVGSKPVTDRWAQGAGFKDLEDLASKVAEGSVDLRHVRGVKPFFRLHPPLKGLKKSANKHYRAGGLLAENPELPKIVERMV
jgi:large subunit ribosomal protein L30